MSLFASSPKRNHQVGLNQNRQVLGDALTGHSEVPAKLIESLAVVLMQLIEEGAPTGIGQSFKDLVHSGAYVMQPNGCIIGEKRQVLQSSLGRRPFLPSLRTRSVLQVKRARSKIDYPVMAAQNFSPEKTGDRLGTPKQIAVDKPLQIDDADVFADDIDRPNR